MSYLGMHVVVDVGSGQLPLDLHDFLQSLSDRVGGQSNERRFFVVFSPGLTTGRWMAAAGMNRYDQYTQIFRSRITQSRFVAVALDVFLDLCAVYLIHHT